MIDLCSAFFSVPLAVESQPLFAFTYQGKQNTLKMKYCLQKQNRTIRETLILVLVLIYLMQRLPKTRGNPQGPLNQDPQLVPSPDINLMNSSHLIQTPLLIYSINVTDQTPAPDGSFTKAMGKLRNLREEINAGQCCSQTDD